MGKANARAMFRGDERLWRALRAWLGACFGFGHRISHAKSKVKNFLVRGFLGEAREDKGSRGKREGSEREQEAGT